MVTFIEVLKSIKFASQYKNRNKIKCLNSKRRFARKLNHQYSITVQTFEEGSSFLKGPPSDFPLKGFRIKVSLTTFRPPLRGNFCVLVESGEGEVAAE